MAVSYSVSKQITNYFTPLALTVFMLSVLFVTGILF